MAREKVLMELPRNYWFVRFEGSEGLALPILGGLVKQVLNSVDFQYFVNLHS